MSWRLTWGMAVASPAAGGCCERAAMLCCEVADACSGGAYTEGDAGPSAAAEVPVHDT